MHLIRKLTFVGGAVLAMAIGSTTLTQAAPLAGLGQAAPAVQATAEAGLALQTEKTYYRRYYGRHYYGYRPRYRYYRPYYRHYYYGPRLFPFF
jgi:hypothetical protein